MPKRRNGKKAKRAAERRVARQELQCKKKTDELVWEKQRRGQCRKHALVCVTGVRFSTKQFNAFCDEFDRKHEMDGGLSRQYFLCYNGDQTIFSFIIAKKTRLQSGYIALSESSGDDFRYLVETDDSIRRTIVFNNAHAWALQKIGDQWFEIDSMDAKHRMIHRLRFPNDCGYVYVKEKL